MTMGIAISTSMVAYGGIGLLEQSRQCSTTLREAGLPIQAKIETLQEGKARAFSLSQMSSYSWGRRRMSLGRSAMQSRRGWHVL
jgi:hypothetical protein